MGELASARVVVTGAGGVIGSRLVRCLAERGANVIAIDLRQPARDAEIDRVRHVVADIGNAQGVQAELAGADVVYHLAYLMGEEANADPVAAARINTLGGTTMLQACLDAKVGRLLFASSISVFGSTQDYATSELPLGDRAPKLGSKGISVYGAGKIYLELLAEHYSRRHGLLVGGLRPGAVIGCSRTTGRAKTVANIVAMAVKERQVTLQNGKAAFPAIHVDDVVGAFLALATADPGTLADQSFFNLAGDHTTVRSFCNDVAAVLPDVHFDILDGDSDELFGTTAFVKDEGIHQIIGYQRRYQSLRAAIMAEVEELTAAPAAI
ncbi:MAG: NAD-dependent epimerase/dehydratase family protein [Afipia sp.]